MGVEVTTLNGVMSDINRVLFIALPTIQLEISIFGTLNCTNQQVICLLEGQFYS